MTLLDLQGLKTPNSDGGGGSGLTLLTCGSVTPSNLSLLLCH